MPKKIKNPKLMGERKREKWIAPKKIKIYNKKKKKLMKKGLSTSARGEVFFLERVRKN